MTSIVATHITYRGITYPNDGSLVIKETRPVIDIRFECDDPITGLDLIVSNTDTDEYDDPLFFYREIRAGGNGVNGVIYLGNCTFRVRPEVNENCNNFYIRGYDKNTVGGHVNFTFSVDLTTGYTNSWQYLGSTILRDTLIANLDEQALITITEKDVIKIFWEGADESWEQPFIIIELLSGGDLNSSRVAYAEMLWRVVCHSPELATAGQLEDAIYKSLSGEDPVVNFTDITSTKIEEIAPVTDRYQVQNVPLFISGGVYQIRLTKE